jgi:hypothetical protein
MPTVLKIGDMRFFFFSREELRMHIHIITPNGEAKYWLEPEIELAINHKLSQQKLNEIEKIIKENSYEFKRAWIKHFGN